MTKSLSRRHCKKRLFRFLSNDRFDPVRVQTALMPKVAAGGRLKGLTPIMIDWTDLGNRFNGLFAAVCFRRRGLPLMSWVSLHGELHPSQNSHEETFAERLFAGLPDAIRPLILADRGFGRAEFIKFLQNLSDSRGNPIDFAVRVKGDVWVESDGFAGNLRNYPLRRRRCVMMRSARYRKDGATKVKHGSMLGSRTQGALASGDLAFGPDTGGEDVPEEDAARAVLPRRQTALRSGLRDGNDFGATSEAVDGGGSGLLPADSGGDANVCEVPSASVFAGALGSSELGAGVLLGDSESPAEALRTRSTAKWVRLSHASSSVPTFGQV